MKLIDIKFNETCSLDSFPELNITEQERLLELGFVGGCVLCPLNKHGRSLIIEIENAKIALDCKIAQKINVSL